MMKQKLYTLLLAGLFFCGHGSAQTYTEKVQGYIATYKTLAMAEQSRSGIPAAITLAQGILESGAGESELATEAGNHFGIKCKSNWRGDTYTHTDDAPDECFRKYGSAEASYRDHSDYLKAQGRYTPCFAQSTTDYAAWAVQLKTCGYATSPTYAQRLIKIIEDYKLQQYTYAALNTEDPLRGSVAGERVPERDAPAPTASAPVVVEKLVAGMVPETGPGKVSSTDAVTEAKVATREIPASSTAVTSTGQGIITREGRRGFWAKKGDVLLEDAIRHRIRYAKLLEINGLPDEPLTADRFVYLEKAGTTRIAADVAAVAGRDETARVTTNAEVQQPVIANVAAPSVSRNREPRAQDHAVRVSEDAAERANETATPEKFSAETMEVATHETIAPVTTDAATAVTLIEESASTTATTQMDQTIAAPEGTPITEDNATTAMTDVLVAATEPMLPSSGSTVADAMTNTNMAAPVEGSATQAEKVVNIADESAAEEQPVAPPPAPEPQDEMSRLKARFDKAVYAPSKPVKPATAATGTSAASVKETASDDKALAEGKPAPVLASAVTGPKFYTVQKGDTAFSIAKKSGITIKQLQDLNGKDFAAIQVGQKLRVK